MSYPNARSQVVLLSLSLMVVACGEGSPDSGGGEGGASPDGEMTPSMGGESGTPPVASTPEVEVHVIDYTGKELLGVEVLLLQPSGEVVDRGVTDGLGKVRLESTNASLATVVNTFEDGARLRRTRHDYLLTDDVEEIWARTGPREKHGGEMRINVTPTSVPLSTSQIQLGAGCYLYSSVDWTGSYIPINYDGCTPDGFFDAWAVALDGFGAPTHFGLRSDLEYQSGGMQDIVISPSDPSITSNLRLSGTSAEPVSLSVVARSGLRWTPISELTFSALDGEVMTALALPSTLADEVGLQVSTEVPTAGLVQRRYAGATVTPGSDALVSLPSHANFSSLFSPTRAGGAWVFSSKSDAGSRATFLAYQSTFEQGDARLTWLVIAPDTTAADTLELPDPPADLSEYSADESDVLVGTTVRREIIDPTYEGELSRRPRYVDNFRGSVVEATLTP